MRTRYVYVRSIQGHTFKQLDLVSRYAQRSLSCSGEQPLAQAGSSHSTHGTVSRETDRRAGYPPAQTCTGLLRGLDRFVVPSVDGGLIRKHVEPCNDLLLTSDMKACTVSATSWTTFR